MSRDFTFELLNFILLTFKFYSIMNAFRNQVSLIGNLGRMPEVKTFEPKFGIRQMLNRFTTRNQWFNETIETIRTSGLPS